MGDLEEEEEFILLDLDEVCKQSGIASNMPYVLSGLDTMNPVLVLDNKIKLIGEYQETFGTCFVFSENDGPQGMEKELEHSVSDVNNFAEGRNVNGNDAFEKQVKPIAQLQKILKFRLFHDVNDQTGEVEAKTYDLHESRPTVSASESDQSMPVSGAEEMKTDDQSVSGAEDMKTDDQSVSGAEDMKTDDQYGSPEVATEDDAES